MIDESTISLDQNFQSIFLYTNEEFETEKLNRYSFINSAIQGAQLMYERK